MLLFVHLGARLRRMSQPGVAGIVAACLLVLPGAALAEPAIRGSWTFSCVSTVTDIDLLPGAMRRLTFSQTNADSVARRIRLVLEITPADGGVLPDAWQFDATGCQGPDRLSWDTYIAAAIKTCPGNFSSAHEAVSYSTSLAAGGERLRLEFERVFSDVSAAAGDRLVLSILFDHTWSVTGAAPDPAHCGGFERGICLRMLEATHESFGGEIRPYVRTNGVYSANVAEAGACEAVPARAVTWGEIKGQYR